MKEKTAVDLNPAMIAFFEADRELTDLVARRAQAQGSADVARTAWEGAAEKKAQVMANFAGGKAPEAALVSAREALGVRLREMEYAEEIVAALDDLTAKKKGALLLLEETARQVHSAHCMEFEDQQLEATLKIIKPYFYGAWHAVRASEQWRTFEDFTKLAFAGLSVEEAARFVPEGITGFPYSKNASRVDRN